MEIDPALLVGAILVGVLLAGALVALAALIGWRLAARWAGEGTAAARLEDRATRGALAELSRTAARAEALVEEISARLGAAAAVRPGPAAAEDSRIAAVRDLLRRLRAGAHATPSEIVAAARTLEEIDLPEADALLELLGGYAAARGGEAAAESERARLRVKRARLEKRIGEMAAAGRPSEEIDPLRDLLRDVERRL